MYFKDSMAQTLNILHTFEKPAFVNMTAFFFREGGMLKNANYTSPGNSAQFNQSDDDFDTTEGFSKKCAICIRRLANGPWA